MEVSWSKYLSSLAKELSSMSDRVRNLIGDAHWLSDGHHKEHLLRSVLNRHLPAGMIAERWFVLDSHSEEVCSREQDILILDCCEEAPVFSDGGLIIAFPSIVRGAISVKATLNKKELEDSISTLCSVRHLCNKGAKMLWTGAFFFKQGNESKALPYSHLAPLASNDQWINMLCAAPDLIYRTDQHETRERETRGFECGELATGIFFAELIDHLAFCRGKSVSDVVQMTSAVADTCQPIRL